jgi:hypothetical protein
MAVEILGAVSKLKVVAEVTHASLLFLASTRPNLRRIVFTETEL